MELHHKEIMKEISKDLSNLYATIMNVKESIIKLKLYKSNNHYKTQYDKHIRNLNREHKFFVAKIKEFEKASLKEKISKVEQLINRIISDTSYDEKLDSIKTLELFWPDLEIEFNSFKLRKNTFDIPKEISDNEQRSDLLEAIKDFDNECYLSSSVACRRAFEGALVVAYKTLTKKEPIEDVKCSKCNQVLRRSYIGIVKLHRWATDNNLIPDKLKPFGFMIADLGAGGAHPPLTDFPRDVEIAKLSIQTTIALLKQIAIKTK